MVDTLGLILFVAVCAACISDSDGAEYIFHETRGRFPRLRTVLVDQGYKGWLVEFAKRCFIYTASIRKRNTGLCAIATLTTSLKNLILMTQHHPVPERRLH